MTLPLIVQIVAFLVTIMALSFGVGWLMGFRAAEKIWKEPKP